MDVEEAGDAYVKEPIQGRKKGVRFQSKWLGGEWFSDADFNSRVHPTLKLYLEPFK